MTYRYSRPSAVLGADVAFATSGGVSPEGLLGSPRFFSGFFGHAEQAAVALRLCARIARTRFYVPPGMLAAVLRAADPVVSSNGDRLRFESFSACCGVYGRMDILPEALDGAFFGVGTTNVDFNPPMRKALARVGGLDPMQLSVGIDDVTVRTMDGEAVERKVPLPQRWLKGFAEVQVAAAGMPCVRSSVARRRDRSCVGCRAAGVARRGRCRRDRPCGSRRVPDAARCASRDLTGCGYSSRSPGSRDCASTARPTRPADTGMPPRRRPHPNGFRRLYCTRRGSPANERRPHSAKPSACPPITSPDRPHPSATGSSARKARFMSCLSVWPVGTT